jgi:uncharacterized membrane-anchored protein YhcB (DUF1043 family)
MAAWLMPMLALAVGVAGGFIGAWIGVRVNLGKLEIRMDHVENEIVKLRASKHEHAQFLTRHELDISMLKMKGDKR